MSNVQGIRVAIFGALVAGLFSGISGCHESGPPTASVVLENPKAVADREKMIAEHYKKSPSNASTKKR